MASRTAALRGEQRLGGDHRGVGRRARLDALRKLYEPHACAMGHYLRLDLPRWTPPPVNAAKPDIWTSVARLRTPGGSDELLNAVSPQATASNLGDDEGFL